MYEKLTKCPNARILRDICPKNYQNARILMISGQKIKTKLPNNFTLYLPEKIPDFFFGGGRLQRLYGITETIRPLIKQ